MITLTELIGDGRALSTLQMCSRAAIIFLAAYILLRISGRRSFSVRSPLDNIIVILLGAILSRAVVGASPLLPVLASSLLIVILHRLIAWLTSAYPSIAKGISGEKILIYKDGKFIHHARSKALISEEEVFSHVRNTLHADNLNDVDKIYMERDGKISILKKADKHLKKGA